MLHTLLKVGNLFSALHESLFRLFFVVFLDSSVLEDCSSPSTFESLFKLFLNYISVMLFEIGGLSG